MHMYIYTYMWHIIFEIIIQMQALESDFMAVNLGLLIMSKLTFLFLSFLVQETL